MRQITTAVTYNWFENVWNEQRRDLIREILAEDVVIHGLGEDTVGVPSFEAFYDSFNAEYSNIHVEVSDVIRQDDMEAGLCQVTGTHKASGKQISFPGMYLVRVRNGQIAEAWNMFDFLTLHTQIGFELKQKEEQPESA